MQIKKTITTWLAGIVVCAMLLTGCGVDNNATLVTINGGEDTISYGYGHFSARYTQSIYDEFYLAYMGEQMWSQSQGEQTMEDSTKEGIMEAMKEEYLLRQHAEEYGVTITKDEKKAITKAAKKFMKSNSKKALNELGATQEIVEEYLTNQTYARKMRTAIRDTADISDIEAEKENEAVAEDVEEKENEAVAEDVEENENEAIAEDTEEKKNEAVAEDTEKTEEKSAEEKIEERKSEHYNTIMDGWKKDLKWKIDKKLWKKVRFKTIFKAK